MGKFLMVVTSSAKDGRDDEYNAWYDGTHLNEICALPGVVSGRRYDAIPVTPHPQPTPYLAIYEIEAEDPASVLGEMMRRSQAGEMSMSDAVDGENAKIWMYEQH
ncbi:hypothetical protein [Novosphingobium sp. JCM 18896]|uniref:hypothetical protein n=1 Tax=Novosphingobium sp. JCM 18896 TaxID=2989731 RepID=UPI002223AECB|nr:hypothetical protein [Novosphingobium sp. JCM 18896]MCW1428497.1 hypothetical protein [Novosphingobium sp. JCM 18896]